MAILEVEDRDGTILKTYQPECASAIDSTVAKQVTNVLYKAYQSQPYQIGRPYAGKSGTTDENSSVWFVGFTPQLSTAIWAGVADNPMRPGQNLMINGEYFDYLYGGPFLGHTWANYMVNALEGQEVQGFEDVFIGNRPVAQPVQRADTAAAQHGAATQDTATPDTPETNTGG